MDDPQASTATGGRASDASVTPDAGLPPLDDQQVMGLREVGRQWAARMPAREAWERSLPVDPHLRYLVDQPTRRSVFVGIRSRSAGEPERSKPLRAPMRPIRGWDERGI